jgi:hypothetical protein
MLRSLIAIFLIFVTWSFPVAAGPVTILSAGFATGATVHNGSGGQDFQFINPAATAFDGTVLSAALDGGSANNTLSYIDGGNTAVIGATLNDTRTGTVGALTQTRYCDGTTAGGLRFSADVDSTYSFAGAFTGSGGAGGQFSILIRFWDITAGNIQLFFQNSDSVRNPVGNLTVGVFGGDLLGAFSGSIAGNLVAGHEYSVAFAMTNQAIGLTGGGPDSGYTANGNFALTVTAQIPEPGMAGIFTLALAAMGFSRMHRRA